jgi:hypothetical protein
VVADHGLRLALEHDAAVCVDPVDSVLPIWFSLPLALAGCAPCLAVYRATSVRRAIPEVPRVATALPRAM